MGTHAVLSPSGAHRWLKCAGSVMLSRNAPDSSSVYADEGTAAHDMAARALLHNKAAAFYVGQKMDNGLKATADMAGYVQEYIDYVRALPSTNYGVFVEVSMALTHITGEKDAYGTADAVVINGTELIVIDLKFGKGYAVEVLENDQLLMYASAAIRHFDTMVDIETVRCVIHQPRVSSIPQEWVVSRAQVMAFVEKAQRVANNIKLGDVTLRPGEKQCQWCKAKATCPALDKFVMAQTEMPFGDLDAEPEGLVEPCDEFGQPLGRMSYSVAPTAEQTRSLSVKRASVDLIKGWCAAVEAAVEKALHAGVKVENWKLVQGNKSPRAWVDAEEAPAVLKAMGLKASQIYESKLASPTQMQKLVKAGDISEAKWSKISGLITQKPGRLLVAASTDKRPAVLPDTAENTFDVISD